MKYTKDSDFSAVDEMDCFEWMQADKSNNQVVSEIVA